MRTFRFIFIPFHTFYSSILLLYEDSHPNSPYSHPPQFPEFPPLSPIIPTLILRIPIIPLAKQQISVKTQVFFRKN